MRASTRYFDCGALHHLPEWQESIADIRRALKPGGTSFFEEVPRAALERSVYRTLLDHPAENRFSEAEFMDEANRHGLVAGPVRRTLFGDILSG